MKLFISYFQWILEINLISNIKEDVYTFQGLLEYPLTLNLEKCLIGTPMITKQVAIWAHIKFSSDTCLKFYITSVLSEFLCDVVSPKSKFPGGFTKLYVTICSESSSFLWHKFAFQRCHKCFKTIFFKKSKEDRFLNMSLWMFAIEHYIC